RRLRGVAHAVAAGGAGRGERRGRRAVRATAGGPAPGAVAAPAGPSARPRDAPRRRGGRGHDGPAAPARRRARRPGRPALLPRRPAGGAGRGRSSMTTDAGPVLRPHAEEEYAQELEALAKADAHPRPPHWQLSPWAVVTYLLGGTLDDGTTITPKYIGPRRVVEVAVATLATDRAL